MSDTSILDKIDVLGPCLSVMDDNMRNEKYIKLKTELEEAYKDNKITQIDFISACSRLSFYLYKKPINNY